jgi:hypothetical protein
MTFLFTAKHVFLLENKLVETNCARTCSVDLLIVTGTSKKLTISGHSQAQTFLQATVLTSVPVHSVYHAILVARALVVDHRALRSPEEALAALACDHSIVDAAAFVPTHFTRYDLNLR